MNCLVYCKGLPRRCLLKPHDITFFSHETKKEVHFSKKTTGWNRRQPCCQELTTALSPKSDLQKAAVRQDNRATVPSATSLTKFADCAPRQQLVIFGQHRLLWCRSLQLHEGFQAVKAPVCPIPTPTLSKRQCIFAQSETKGGQGGERIGEVPLGEPFVPTTFPGCRDDCRHTSRTGGREPGGTYFAYPSKGVGGGPALGL